MCMICAYFNYIPVVTGSNLHEHYSNGDGDSKRIAREGLAGAFMESPAYIEYNFLNL